MLHAGPLLRRLMRSHGSVLQRALQGAAGHRGMTSGIHFTRTITILANTRFGRARPACSFVVDPDNLFKDCRPLNEKVGEEDSTSLDSFDIAQRIRKFLSV
jgi:hypothetical protein